MTKTESQMKVLEQAFWQTYPTLSDHRHYTFDDLFPMLDPDTYDQVLWDMVESCVLPLMPVIPLQNNGEIYQYGLYYH